MQAEGADDMADLAEQIYRQFKQDLMDDKFPLDEMIIEQDLVERYGASRTPVREAATRLVHEGYLKKYPKKGYTIRCNNEKEIKDMGECRYLMECGIIDRLVVNASDAELRSLLDHSHPLHETMVERSLAFHLNMARLAKNDYLYHLLENLLFMLIRPAAYAQRRTLEDYTEKATEPGYHDEDHQAIVSALLARDAKTAKEILRRDIRRLSPDADI